MVFLKLLFVPGGPLLLLLVNLDCFNQGFALWEWAMRFGQKPDSIHIEPLQGAAQRFQIFADSEPLSEINEKLLETFSAQRKRRSNRP